MVSLSDYADVYCNFFGFFYNCILVFLRGLNLILGELLKIYRPPKAFKILYAGEIVQAVLVIL